MFKPAMALVCAVFAGSMIARADTLQLAPGAAISVSFSISAFPSTVGFDLAGMTPSSATLAAIPGSSMEYYSGILLEGWLESQDGSVSVPLFDADAYRLGLPVGDIIAAAQYGGGTLSEAEAVISRNLADSLFGDSGRAQIVIRNMGGAFTIGLDGYSLANAIVEPLSDGKMQTAGHSQTMQLSTPIPEPAVWSAIAGGCMLMFLIRNRLR